MIEKQDTWTCLVLLEPTEEDLLFCYRHVDREGSLDRPPPNAHCTTGRCYYSIEEESLQNTITYITTNLLVKHQDCAGFVRYLTRALQRLRTTFIEVPDVPDPLGEVEISLTTVAADATKAAEFVNATIGMVYLTTNFFLISRFITTFR
jgi:hypothetical protein